MEHMTATQKIWQAAIRESQRPAKPSTAGADLETTTKRIKKTALENELARQLRAVGVSFEQNKRFHDTRRWLADFILWDEMIIAEIEGGIYEHRTGKKFVGKDGREHEVQSRHLTPGGFREDCIKYNEMAALGFRVLRFTSDLVWSGEARDMILRLYDQFHGADAFIARKLYQLSSAAPSNVVFPFQKGPDNIA